ncbi:hypothetical protein Plhal304r1_c007g0028931 [Plasmopara halstedii]
MIQNKSELVFSLPCLRKDVDVKDFTPIVIRQCRCLHFCASLRFLVSTASTFSIYM